MIINNVFKKNTNNINLKISVKNNVDIIQS